MSDGAQLEAFAYRCEAAAARSEQANKRLEQLLDRFEEIVHGISLQLTDVAQRNIAMEKRIDNLRHERRRTDHPGG